MRDRFTALRTPAIHRRRGQVVAARLAHRRSGDRRCRSRDPHRPKQRPEEPRRRTDTRRTDNGTAVVHECRALPLCALPSVVEGLEVLLRVSVEFLHLAFIVAKRLCRRPRPGWRRWLNHVRNTIQRIRPRPRQIRPLVCDRQAANEQNRGQHVGRVEPGLAQRPNETGPQRFVAGAPRRDQRGEQQESQLDAEDCGCRRRDHRTGKTLVLAHELAREATEPVNDLNKPDGWCGFAPGDQYAHEQHRGHGGDEVHEIRPTQPQAGRAPSGRGGQKPRRAKGGGCGP